MNPDARQKMYDLLSQILKTRDPRHGNMDDQALILFAKLGSLPNEGESRTMPSPEEIELKELIRLEGPLVDLWLDDVRSPHVNGMVGALWVKTAALAIAALETGAVRFASLDHDLDHAATIGLPPVERTGYDVVTWMEENNSWPPMGVRIHSMNPAGAQRMRQVVARHYGRLF